MSLRSFLKQMKKQKQVLNIKDELSTRFEIPFVMKKFDSQGLILVFEKVKGYKT
ncbi:UbiD family decarboxylase, partial [Candidatus Bathyarchaeota archaeon]